MHIEIMFSSHTLWFLLSFSSLLPLLLPPTHSPFLPPLPPSSSSLSSSFLSSPLSSPIFPSLPSSLLSRLPLLSLPPPSFTAPSLPSSTHPTPLPTHTGTDLYGPHPHPTATAEDPFLTGCRRTRKGGLLGVCKAGPGDVCVPSGRLSP